MKGARWQETDELFHREGFTREQLAELRLSNPARGLEPTRYFEAEHVADGDEITVGRWKFTCVSVPGHTTRDRCVCTARRKS